MSKHLASRFPAFLALLQVGLLLFGVEFAIMALLPLLGLEPFWESLADSFLLALGATPMVYFLGRTWRGASLPVERRTLEAAERWTAGALVAQAGLVAAVAAVHALLASGEESSAHVINLAGRQRFLCAQLTSEALARPEGESEEGPPVRRDEEPWNVRAARFERVLGALLHGDPELGLPRCATRVACGELERAAGLWSDLHPLLASPLLDVEARAAAMDLARQLVRALDAAVGRLEEHFTKQTRVLKRALQATALTAVAVGVVLVGCFVTVLRRRREVEASLERSERSYRHVVASAGDAIVAIDGRGLICEFNPAAERLFGAARSEVLGGPLVSLMPERYREPHRRALERYLATGGRHLSSWEYLELEGRRRDGTEFPLELSFSVLDTGEEKYITAVLRDISERKEAQAALSRARAELEESLEKARELALAAEAANRAKSEFLANMSHEIRTPMTAILGYTELLLEAGLSAEERSAHSAVIRKNGDHLLAILNDILDLSKIESGRLQVERVRCSPVEILSEVASLMAPRAAEKRLKFRVTYAGPVPETIETDPTRLRQILLNLTGNAIKFTSEGSVRLVVRLSDADSSRPLLRFDVIDTGVGLDPDERARLFEPFSQADTSTTRRFGGSGLGLSISRRLARMLGGDIEVQSISGAGSTFSATVETGCLDGVRMLRHPSGVRPRGKGAETRSPAARRLAGRILVAEDAPDNRKLLSLYLQKAGAEVAVAENGQAACDLVLAAEEAGRPFDLVLMDMQMPVLDGYAATARLRERGHRGPIIALTAAAMAAERRRCLEAGCDDFAAKPIGRLELVDLAARYLGGTGGAGGRGRAPLAAPEEPALDPDAESLLEEFLECFRRLLGELEAALARGDLEAAARAAHQLKGTGGTFGLPRVSEAAARLEEAARSGNVVLTRGHFEELRRLGAARGVQPARQA